MDWNRRMTRWLAVSFDKCTIARESASVFRVEKICLLTRPGDAVSQYLRNLSLA